MVRKKAKEKCIECCLPYCDGDEFFGNEICVCDCEQVCDESEGVKNADKPR